MKRKTLGLTGLFFLALLSSGCATPPPPPPPPPPMVPLQEVAQQGFHDGYDAAQHDVSAGHPPVFDHHPRYRNPPVPPETWEVYRREFRHGYEHFLHPN